MTERGLPIADASPACPFVAFVDDRDGRADRPDHRHRCFAEDPPAPRAAAHQEAYCLSSAFPVCPVFQEWARREAAQARRGEPPSPEPSGATVAGAAGAAGAAVTSPDGRAEEWASPRPPVEATPVEYVPKRNPPRSWAAPPPWATGASGAPGAAGASGAAPGSGDDVPGFLTGQPDPSRGLAGSPADRLTSAGAAAATDAQLQAEAARAARGDVPSSGPHPDVASLVGASAAGAAAAAPHAADQRLAADRDAERTADELDYARATGAAPVAPRSGRRPSVSSTRSAQQRAANEGPSWERARRTEAYPQIKSPVGLPAVPRVGLLAIALVVAAFALFFIGPDLIGIGGGSAEPTATPRPSVAVTPPPSPTAVPAPTPQVYVIKEGDTLSKIADEYGLTLDELLAANETTIEDPDRISVGDEIIIPTAAPDEVGGASESPAP
jgi:LysM repeat protein